MKHQDVQPLQDERLMQKLPRRAFLKYAGLGSAGITALIMAAGCHKDNNSSPAAEEVNLGSGDVGILNYAYALEQLEAAFYTQVVQTPYSGITDMELSFFTDIRDHEIAHREFFKAALSTSAIASLQFDFSSINFSSRSSVIATAKAFEDLGVSAYNGAGVYLQTPDYLTLAGKIVSVEARHAAYLRELVMSDTFVDSDVVDNNGLDLSRKPSEVLVIASTYIKTKINASGLPQ
ncbi:MAG: ferritin-like domain-containing protein [Thermoflavifilum sp.]|nr:ferritin-like domain-containing protein [Thermoflavifilum sp.]